MVTPILTAIKAALLPRWHQRQRQRSLLFLILAGLWVAFDQATKVAVRTTLEHGEHWDLAPFFRFSHVTNDGAAFGLLGNMNTLLAVTAVVVVIVLIVYFLMPPVNHWLPQFGLSLILGGALGNLLDRLYEGRVTDFIDFKYYPAFNVADSGITIGIVAILAYFLLWGGVRRDRPAAHSFRNDDLNRSSDSVGVKGKPENE